MGFQTGITPKRSLGQNFLVNDDIIKKISNIVLDSNPKHITEIGPGKGAFTKVFYATTIDISLVEKDITLAQLLQNNYTRAKTYNKDFLNFELINPDTTYFGSLPFNVANQIIYKIITSETFKRPAFFIIQKEVAQKYLNKEVNPLGLIREIYSDFKILFDIKAGNFKPRPNVTSSFVEFIPHSKFKDVDKKALETLIQTSFRSPRKTLSNNLKPLKYKIPENLKAKRPAQLALEDYISILELS